MPIPEHVHVLVLDWNGHDHTLACLTSLSRLRFDGYRVVVIDNGSTVPVRPAIEAAHPGIEIVETGQNLGYAGGNNVGLRRSLDRGAEFIWVLNNDTIVDAGALEALVETARRHPRAGAVGSRVLRADRPGTIWVAWGELTWLQSLIRLVGQDRPDGPLFRSERQVEWIPGCSILFRSAALRDVGLFDEDFFAYHEDVEWASRAREAGWELWYAGISVVHHAIHGSSGGESKSYLGFRSYLSARNSVLFARRHGRLWQRTLMAAAIVVTLPFQFVRRALRGELAGLRMKLRGWRDGLAGRPIPLAELGLRPHRVPERR
jgi:GT2 family glycosyltransferase